MEKAPHRRSAAGARSSFQSEGEAPAMGTGDGVAGVAAAVIVMVAPCSISPDSTP